jgi:uncharacterized iron-regulated membrane protein
MRAFRTALFWIHLTVGSVAGIIVLLMSVTGVLLTYERQILAWADGGRAVIQPAAGATRLTFDELVRSVTAANPGVPLTSVTIRSDPRDATSVVLGPRTVFVDPYDGHVIGEGSARARAFFRRMTDWHRWLGASAEQRASARAVTGAANLGFLFLVVSGAYLWLPRVWSWPRVRNVMWFRRGLAGKARDFNWHNVIGVWSVLPLLVIVGSGVVMSYPWANDLVYRVAGEAPPARQTAGVRPGGARPDGPRGTPFDISRLDAAWPVAAAQTEGWTSITVRLPATADAPLSFVIDTGDGGQPQRRGTLTMSSSTGEIVRWEPFAALTPGRRLRSYLRFAHTGEVAGLPGQTIAGVASVGGVVLVVTGMTLAIRRGWARVRRSSSRAAASTSPV